MNKPSKLAAEIAGALMVASLLGTSAFAESRHHDGTRDQQSSNQQQSRGRVERGTQGGSRSYDRGSSQQNYGYQNNGSERSRGWDRGQVQAPQVVQPQQQQRYDRGNRSYDNNRDANRGSNGGAYQRDNRGYNGGAYQRDNRGYNGGAYQRDNRGYNGGAYQRDNRGYNGGAYQRDNRGYSNRGYDNHGGSRGYGHYSYPSRDGRAGAVMEGRIARINHERGGYRVWFDRGGYSYWVPEARFRLWPLRVGLSIRFGGWWNPLGYYDVYDMGPYNGPFYTSGDLHGVVESVDYARGTVVLRDDLSGSFVTAVLRGGDPRLGDMRPGDYVDLAGAWTRGGYFDAYQLQDLRQGGGYANGPYDGY